MRYFNETYYQRIIFEAIGREVCEACWCEACAGDRWQAIVLPALGEIANGDYDPPPKVVRLFIQALVPYWDIERERYSNRFRKVSNRYPLQVTSAYGGDGARAMADSDEQVAATVADWERAQGLEPRDWQAIGRAERELA